MSCSARLIALALISATAAAGSAMAAPDCPAAGSGQVAVISDPAWTHTPDGEDMGRYYPGMALKEHKTDQTFVDCAITPQGKLTDCKVVKDDRPGEGFDRASLGLVKIYKMPPPDTIAGYASLPDCVKKLGPPHTVVHIFWNAGG